MPHMLGRTYDDQICSIARALEVLGERWTILVVRDAMLGVKRFEDFQSSLGVARNVLTDRLRRLVDAGVLRRVPYQERPQRFEYQLTKMGVELAVPIVALMHWGDKHLPVDGGPPRLIQHRGCGGAVEAELVCQQCGLSIEPFRAQAVAGPGLVGEQERVPVQAGAQD
jgi:DNA-binding HxlR family transcriptional regulator